MRRAFTLIEIMVAVAIIALIATFAFVGAGEGDGAARLKGATRAVFATVRQARSVAIVTQKPAVVTYSNTTADGESCIDVRLDSVKLMDTSSSGVVQTLSGETVNLADPTGAIEEARNLAAMRGERADDAAAEAEAGTDAGGESIEDILFAAVDKSVMAGMAIKVVVGDAAAEDDKFAGREEGRVSAVSAFSNIDSLLGKYQEAKRKEPEEAKDGAEEERAPAREEPADDGGTPGPVSVAWEPNGRCEPHRIWVYKAGTRPEHGLQIAVDRFGSARALTFEEMER